MVCLGMPLSRPTVPAAVHTTRPVPQHPPAAVRRSGPGAGCPAPARCTRRTRSPTTPLPLPLIAGSRLAGQAGVWATELDSLVRRLLALDAGVDTDGHAQRAFTGTLPRLWEAG